MITLEQIDKFLQSIETLLTGDLKEKLLEIRKQIYESEKWKTIQDHPEYLVSNKGRVKSIKKDKPIFLKPGLSVGYFTINLCEDGYSESHDIHRLVAEAFIPNPENKKCVNHIDGNKLNNQEENLEWVTHSENTQHAFISGLQKPNIRRGEKHGMSKLTESEVKQIRTMYKNEDITYRKIAKIFHVSQGTITAIINRKLWKEVE